MDTTTITHDLVETAQAADCFSSLVKACQAAGLVDLMKSPGPFTMFAPSDDAFDHLPSGAMDQLLRPEHRDKLAGLLCYHITGGKSMASEVASMSSATTVAGPDLQIRVSDDRVMINNATVIQPDIECTNGVIHVIDSVLFPPEG